MVGTRSVQRALKLLRVMNERRIWTLAQIVERMELPKTTVHRLLQTLQQERYVRCDESAHGMYRLTPQVQNLSWGVTEESILVDAAAKILIAGTKQIKWPLSLGVIDGCQMRVDFCAMPYSPYAVRATSYGRRYDLLTSALGKAYLAFCSRAERRILIELLCSSSEEPYQFQPAFTRSVIRETRRAGYGVRRSDSRGESDAFAVPIFADSLLLGALVYSTYKGKLTEEIISRYLPVMEEIVRQIGERFLARSAESLSSEPLSLVSEPPAVCAA